MTHLTSIIIDANPYWTAFNIQSWPEWMHHILNVFFSTFSKNKISQSNIMTYNYDLYTYMYVSQ